MESFSLSLSRVRLVLNKRKPIRSLRTLAFIFMPDEVSHRDSNVTIFMNHDLKGVLKCFE
jgi:hypothetical protein